MNKPPVIEMINYSSSANAESVFSDDVENTVFHRIDTPRICPSSSTNSLHDDVPKNTKKDKKVRSDLDKKVKNKNQWNRWA